MLPTNLHEVATYKLPLKSVARNPCGFSAAQVTQFFKFILGSLTCVPLGPEGRWWWVILPSALLPFCPLQLLLYSPSCLLTSPMGRRESESGSHNSNAWPALCPLAKTNGMFISKSIPRLNSTFQCRQVSTSSVMNESNNSVEIG